MRAEVQVDAHYVIMIEEYAKDTLHMSWTEPVV